MLILIDMDGITMDLHTPWLSAYTELTGDTLQIEQIVDYETSQFVKYPAELYSIFDRPGFYDQVLPIPGAVKAVRALRESYDVHFCTATHNADWARSKIELAEKYFGIGYKDVVLTHHKHLVEADILIDDKPATLEKWYKKKRLSATIAWPWNLTCPTSFMAHGWRDTEAAWQSIVKWVDNVHDRTARVRGAIGG